MPTAKQSEIASLSTSPLLKRAEPGPANPPPIYGGASRRWRTSCYNSNMTTKDAHWHQFVEQLHRLDDQWTHFLEQRQQLDEQRPQLGEHWRQFVKQHDTYTAQQCQLAEQRARLGIQQEQLELRRQAVTAAQVRQRPLSETPIVLFALAAVFVTLLQLATG